MKTTVIALALALLLMPNLLLAQSRTSPAARESVRTETRQDNPAQVCLDLMNEARTNPKAFSDKHLKALTTPAARECYAQMQSMAALPAMTVSDVLLAAATEHAEDLKATNTTGHVGSDGSQFWERIERHGEWSGNVGENVSYGLGDPLAVVIQLLVDEGVPTRGHRENILNPEHKVVGICFETHPQWSKVCVQVFATSAQ